MKKIFLDVGGHRGETIECVLLPKYRFDLVHCFEPIPELYEHIKTTFAKDIASGKLQLHNFGLADFNGEHKLYGTGEQEQFGDGLGASLFADKSDIDNRHFLTCEFVNASDWLTQNAANDDLILLKMNCEGGEVLILRDLMASGKIHDLHFVYIDFDSAKIPSQKAEQEKILAELKAIGFDSFTINMDVCYRSIDCTEKTRRMICAMPNASLVADLTSDDIALNRFYKYTPTWLFKKMLRRRYRKLHKLTTEN